MHRGSGLCLYPLAGPPPAHRSQPGTCTPAPAWTMAEAPLGRPLSQSHGCVLATSRKASGQALISLVKSEDTTGTPNGEGEGASRRSYQMSTFQ